MRFTKKLFMGAVVGGMLWSSFIGTAHAGDVEGSQVQQGFSLQEFGTDRVITEDQILTDAKLKVVAELQSLGAASNDAFIDGSCPFVSKMRDVLRKHPVERVSRTLPAAVDALAAGSEKECVKWISDAPALAIQERELWSRDQHARTNLLQSMYEYVKASDHSTFFRVATSYFYCQGS